jgi:ribose transport system substrate-binding protein
VAKGIKVVSMNNPLGPDMRTMDPQVEGQTANVMDASQYQRGVWLGELAVDACADKDPCEVAYIAGSVALAGEQALIGGFREAIAAKPAIRLAAYVDAGDYTAEPGQRAAQNILQAHPDVRAIAGSGDQIIRGAAIAVRSAGRDGEVALIGLGGSKAGVQGVIDGSWYGTVANLPFSIGKASFDVLEKAFADPNLRGVAVNVSEELRLDPKITRANAADFRAEWDG